MQDYEKFKQIYAEIDELIKKQVTSEDAEFITWHTKRDFRERNTENIPNSRRFLI